VLHLASATSADWLARALAAMDVVLVDHAHCEKKAASTAINLIFRYQDRADLMAPLSALAREELEHFELLLGVLARRGIAVQPIVPSPYASRLYQAVRKGEPNQLLDTLLCCALIEARSCERMRLLAQALPDPDLAALYGSLLASEARHHQAYLDLCHAHFDRDVVRLRLSELASHEAAALAGDAATVRLHS
jgi:tRNA-(ms[2]io[6]A)-hydroxylase